MRNNNTEESFTSQDEASLSLTDVDKALARRIFDHGIQDEVIPDDLAQMSNLCQQAHLTLLKLKAIQTGLGAVFEDIQKNEAIAPQDTCDAEDLGVMADLNLEDSNTIAELAKDHQGTLPSIQALDDNALIPSDIKEELERLYAGIDRQIEDAQNRYVALLKPKTSDAQAAPNAEPVGSHASTPQPVGGAARFTAGLRRHNVETHTNNNHADNAPDSVIGRFTASSP